MTEAFYLLRFEAFLSEIVSKKIIPAQRIQEALRYTLFPGGKRLRPLLVYFCGELLTLDLEILDVIAAAIELTHCYSLIHDDLPAMDNDDIRRGKPSCHKAFDEATAILVGDGLQAFAIEVLSDLQPRLDATKIITLIQELLNSSGLSGMISGQSLDLSELLTPVSEEQLYAIHTLKTGKLFSACINMTLAAANPSHGLLLLLKKYASHVGVAFQMQDDYLDTYSTGYLGKNNHSDLTNKKFTFANLHSQNQLKALINEQFQQAKEALAPLMPQAKSLLELTQKLHNRINEH